MVLRRGDWETGDVICHECHLTAPPFPLHLLPICLLSHISPFLVCLNFVFFFLTCVPVSPFFVYSQFLIFFFLLFDAWLFYIHWQQCCYNKFSLISDSAHINKSDGVYLNNLFCAPCLNIIFPSLLPVFLHLPPPPPPHRQISFWQTIRIWLTLGANCARKIEGTKTKDITTPNRNTHMHIACQNVKPTGISAILSCVQCIFNL